MHGLLVILLESCFFFGSPLLEILLTLATLRYDARFLITVLKLQLYSHTNIGTKRVVEDYISEVQEALQFLLRVESPLVSDSHKLDQLTCLRQVNIF